MLTNSAKMNDFELENVVGGTVSEFNSLVAACAKNPILRTVTGFGSHIPIANNVAVRVMESLLSDMGIFANIDLGFVGTGIGSRHNTYIERSTGEHLSQIEVEKRLAEYAI